MVNEDVINCLFDIKQRLTKLETTVEMHLDQQSKQFDKKITIVGTIIGGIAVVAAFLALN